MKVLVKFKTNMEKERENFLKVFIKESEISLGINSLVISVGQCKYIK